MSANDHLKQPKHGTEKVLNYGNPQIKEIFQRILYLQNTATVDLVYWVSNGLFIENNEKKIQIGCTQCIKNIALQYRDLSEAINELVEFKDKD